MKFINMCIFLFMINVYANENTDYEYIQIKKTRNKQQIRNYYMEKIIRNTDKIANELNKFYEKSLDNEAAKYIFNIDVEEYKKEAIETYTNNIIEKCENRICSNRLVNFYYILYDKIKDIELLGMLLDYSRYIQIEKYNEIYSYTLKNHSLNAIKKYNFELGTENEKQNMNNKIILKNKEYRVIQKEKNPKDKKSEIFLIASEEKKELYLYIELNNQLKKVADYFLGYSQILKILDINKDGMEDIIIETQFPNNIYIFNFNNGIAEEKFDTLNLYTDKYYTLKDEFKNLIKEVRDDFGYRKREVIKLPNIKEVLDRNDDDVLSKTLLNTYYIIDNRLFFRIMGIQNYEAVFDKNFKVKMKAIINKNNDLNLSNSYFY